ncbi:glucosaminidase domain-containing protein [Sansalvadorimonas verongulae]|uniref:glucosaminidase domain-containing protein n=1 Tax=Sansalvadorimonas verongulae TaxID=2172824 RepID=UPI0012BBBE5D|nr:glucosaminidase domain-containing protein [Sansalvadorimonas verongulae]MTI12738.1 hypothetical protein [Sansalvadorimonas verongulae]
MRRTSIDFTLLALLIALIGISQFVPRPPEHSLEVALEITEPDEPVVVKVTPKQAWELAGVPDFTAIQNVQEKKDAFFSYFLPMVEHQNRMILKHRSRLIALRANGTSSESEQAWLDTMGRIYRVPGVHDDAWFAEMLMRVDIIPPSLALAQAANESGWGTSRFAREGNNYFGQWCFTKGCGLVPNSRASGFSHEVRKFDEVSDSVRSYMHNLNSHREYQALRELRANAHTNNMTITGAYLAQGLGSYSERGYEYVDELVRMINGNRLARFDEALEVAGDR